MKQKKLVFKKEIVSNLNVAEMDEIKGGVEKVATKGACETEPIGPIRCVTDYKCNTIDHCV